MKEGMKILVAYDGSEEAHRALVEAVNLAKQFKGSLTALNVYWDVTQNRYAPILVETEGISASDEGSLRILENAKNYLEENKVKYELRTERNPNTPKAIMDIAEKDGYGCIALGSRGIGGVRAWLLGSVSSRVIAEASCPVIVV
jgi:nucleotide-binding universal stress UspA family protein